MLLALESLHVTRNSSDSAKITLRRHVKEEGKAIELRNYLNSEATEEPMSKGFTRVSKAFLNHTYELTRGILPFHIAYSQGTSADPGKGAPQEHSRDAAGTGTVLMLLGCWCCSLSCEVSRTAVNLDSLES